jgi:signal transduction histidine kinase
MMIVKRLLMAVLVSFLMLSGAVVCTGDSSVLHVAIAPDLLSNAQTDAPYLGLARDIVELVGRKADCKVVFVDAATSEVDMLLGHFTEEEVADAPGRYSSNLLLVPAVLVGREGGARPTSSSELVGLRIGVGHSYGLAELANRRAEGLHFEPVESDLFGLMKVSLGELDLMLIDLATASELIEHEGITNLHLIARLGPLLHLRLKVLNRDPDLVARVLDACEHIAWYDRRELTEKWLGFGALPFHRSPVFWRWAGSLILIGLLVISNVLLWNRALRREVRIRKQMARDILTISSDERARIGRDLHDSIGQQLVGITYLSELSVNALETDDKAEAVTKMERVRTVTEEAIRQTRFVARGLMPVDLRKEGLATALENLIQDTNKNSNVTCTLYLDESVPPIPVSPALQLYRIAQEALGNALKHGEVTQIEIKLQHKRKRWCYLKVRDDGKGIEDASSSEGLGFKIMRYRAHIIGAKIRVQNVSPHGTEVRCRFPIRSAWLRGEEQ